MGLMSSGGTWIGSGGGGSTSITIGDPVIGGDPNDVLFVDPFGNLGQNDNFTFTNTSGLILNIGVLSMSDDGAGDGYIYSNTTSAQVLFSDTGQVRIKSSAAIGLVIDEFGASYFASDLTIGGHILDTFGIKSIGANDRNLYGTGGATVCNWDAPGGDHFRVTNVVEFSATGLTNDTLLFLDDTAQQVYVSGNFTGIVFTGETFTPGGFGAVNDLSVTGTYTSLMVDDYTIAIVDNAAIQFDFAFGFGFGSFNVGDTITDGLASGIIFSVSGTSSGTMVLTGVLGTFSNSDVISNGSFNASISTDPVIVDIINWSDTQSNSGSGLVQDTSIALSNGLSISFLIPSATPRFIGDTWTLSYGLVSAPYVGFLADYVAGTVGIGDVQGEINNTAIVSNVTLGVNQLFNNFDYQNSYKTINAIDPTDPQDYATKNYVDTSAGGGLSIGAPVTGGTPNDILFVDVSGNLGEDNSFQFDSITGLVKVTGFEDGSSVEAVSINHRTLIDSSVATSIDWENRFLEQIGQVSLDWGQYRTFDSGAFESIDWNLRQLYTIDSTLTHVAVDWGSRVLGDSTGARSFDWENRVALDSSALESILYNSRELWDSSSTIVLNWENKQLFNSSGNLTADWSGSPFAVTRNITFSGGTGLIKSTATGVEYGISTNPSGLYINKTTGKIDLTDATGFGLHTDASGNIIIDQALLLYSSLGTVQSGYLSASSGIVKLGYATSGITGFPNIQFAGAGQSTWSDASGFGVQLDASGNTTIQQYVLINGATHTTNSGIGISGHWDSQGSSPSIAGSTGATVSVSQATDTAGRISLTPSGLSTAIGTQFTVTFAKPYSVAPIVVITPTNANSGLASLGFYVSATSTTTFSVANLAAITPSSTYTWNYIVIETK